ncbi:MAG: hypothetical protein LBH18_01295 [Spirochaetaceae bacterium]|nr:hypothetical protein [Spirochaetaceae bacterium]
MIITNCRTGGSITGKVTGSGNRNLLAGGIIGDVGLAPGAGDSQNEKIVINNCYSTMKIELTNESSSQKRFITAGGVVGYYSNNKDSTEISNSVALNPVITVVKGGASDVHAHRVIGFRSGNGTMKNNYALSTMKVDENTISGRRSGRFRRCEHN